MRSKVVVFPSFSERGQTGENARANAVSGRALSPVKIKIPVAPADMRRHSDTLRGAQRRRKRGLRGENNRTSFLQSKVVVFPSYSKKSVFSRTCAGKRHLKSRERGDESGGQRGRKRVKRKRLPVVVPVLTLCPLYAPAPLLPPLQRPRERLQTPAFSPNRSVGLQILRIPDRPAHKVPTMRV